MRNLLLYLSYDGTAYHGWQVQENAPTVQQTFQDAWQKICGTRDNVVGCSRTDAGVHANMFCCNVRTDNPISCQKLIAALNAVLPEDIAVNRCVEVPYEFHARYDCVKKEYIYRIWNAPTPSPFLRGRAWHYAFPLDEAALNRAAQAFVGTHDFTAFCSSGSSVEEKTRTVVSCSVTRTGEEVDVRIAADGFLYNMVRIIVGTLIAVAQGKTQADSLPDVIESKDRNRAGATAPPQGLYLNRVWYGGDTDEAKTKVPCEG